MEPVEPTRAGRGAPGLTRRHCMGGLACGFAALRPGGSPARAAAVHRRIATPDRAGTQTLLSLGLTPSAAVSKEFYDSMGATPTMPGSVVSCGSPVEPNLEVLARLHIDLIVTGTIPPDTRNVLARVAPVFHLDIYTGQDGALARAESETLRLARLLGVEEAGRAHVAYVARTIDREAARLKTRPRRAIYIVGLAPDGRNMTVYGRNSIMYDVMAALGVENAWTGPTGGAGFTNTGVEELARNPEADILHIDYGAGTDAALAKLAASPFWTSLPMVQAGRVRRVPRFEVFGSLPLAAQFATLMADALLDERST